MKAKTDEGPKTPNAPMPDYIENIFQLMQLTGNTEVYEKYRADYDNCNIRYGDMKKQLVNDMITFIKPIREKAIAIRNNETFLKDVLEGGAEKARQSAEATMKLVREAVGTKYF